MVIKVEANELKQYIIENNLIKKILESLDCHSIKEHTTEYRAGLPDRQNTTSICVKKDTLSTAIRTSDGTETGDIFTLVMHIKNISFGKSVRYLHELFNINVTFYNKKKTEIKDNPLQIFEKVKSHRHIVNEDVPCYDESCLKEYVPLPYIGWIREGIMPFCCEKFGIGYSYDRKRIVIPERKWDGEDNEYIGIAGRTTVPNADILGIPKYTKLSLTYPKGQNVYALNENYDAIQKAGYCVVFEAQKSPLKRYSRKDETGVSIGCCELSDTQIKILISLNVDIVIALDEGVSINHIRKQCENFYPIRNVYFIYDKWGLLGEGSKNSPADMPNKVYNFLFKHRFKYDEHERSEYKAWREKQKKNYSK